MRQVSREYTNSANKVVIEDLLVVKGRSTGIITSREGNIVRENNVTGKQFIAMGNNVTIDGQSFNVFVTYPAKLVAKNESFDVEAIAASDDPKAALNEQIKPEYQVGTENEVGLRVINGRDGNPITLGKIYLEGMNLAASAGAVQRALAALTASNTPAETPTVGG